ncbi:MAG: class II aldolase [Armatimonadetes bacterium]|jgi:rhamnose utilization protein RhaD (predicted bifunctional aldolase and dehydrogenase)|nr:class II aldolase [Armatimonadota bacterium]
MDDRYQKVLQQLTAMSARLGEPERDLVILGEGNTSAAVDEEIFLIKASGQSLVGIQPEGFVAVRRPAVMELLKQGSLTDAQIKDGLRAASVNPEAAAPSIEATFHALLLGLEGIRFVGHTHPTMVNALLCARDAEKVIGGSLFPDQIVVCGPAPLLVPYTDPGLPLAHAIRDGIRAHVEQHGEIPKVILLRNHGLIALGRTPAEVESVTAMWVKTCRVLLATAAFGGPQFLSPENVERIHRRPDEALRRQLIFR